MLCSHCGSQVSEGAEACKACGRKLVQMDQGNVPTLSSSGTRRHRVAVESSPYNMGDLLAGRFEVLSQVGTGPTGWVYKCVDRDLDVDVAVKVISPRLISTDAERRRLSTQLRRLGALVHDNVVRVYESGEDGGRAFFTMQNVDALSLRRIWELRREKGQPFTLAEVNELVKQIASAVDEAHRKGLSHGALKPDNILLLPDAVKVSDFGLAEALPRASFLAAQQTAGVGRYLAPELRRGDDIDPSADVFSLGLIVGEMLGGAPLDPGEVKDGSQANFPEGVKALFLRATAQDPADRFDTAGAFAQALAEALPRPGAPRSKAGRKPAPPPAPVVEDDSVGDLDFDEDITDAEIDAPLPPRPPTQAAFTTSKVDEPKPRGSSLARAEAAQSAEPAWATRAEGRKAAGRSGARPPINLPAEPPPSKAPKIVAALLVVLIAGVFFYLAWGDEGRRDASLSAAEVAPAVVAEASIEADEPEAQAEVESETGSDADTAAAEPEASAAADPVQPKATPEPPADKRPVAVASALSKEERRAAARAEILREVEEREKKRRLDEAMARLEELDKQAETEARNAEFERAAKAVVSVKRKEPEPDAVPASAPAPVAAKEPTCTPGMRLIPAGTFRFGALAGDGLKNFSDLDQASVTTAAYCIDLYEYPNRKGARPGTNVKFSQAVASCKARGKRLCTEQEWERACKGPSNRHFPYGNAFDADACNTEDAAGQVRQVSDTGSFSKCASGYGVYDMAGNVAEWTDSPFDSGPNRVVKGGAANRPDFATRCAARVEKSPESRDVLIGFRCCADPA